MGRIAIFFSAAAFVIASATSAPAAIDKCQKAISKEILKLESKVVKSIVKGADAFQKAEAKGSAISSITGKVNDTLAKTIDTGNSKSAISKALTKLASIGPSDKATCSDTDLFTLGFLPEGLAGDRWRRLAVIAALQTGYNNAVLGNATLGNDYQAMVDAGGCALCSMIATPPCVAQTCRLDPSSGGQTNGALGMTPVSTTGAVPITSCDVPSVMPAGEFATIGGPQSGIDPIFVVATPGSQLVACVTTLRTMGVANCVGGTMPSVDSHHCSDHIVEDIGGIIVDECEDGSGTVQVALPDLDDPTHGGVVNGGGVSTFTANPPAAGESFVLTTNRIQLLVETLGEFGPDGVPCSPDDTPAIVTPSAVQAQTTGTATSEVIDRDNVEGVGQTTTTTVTGTPFDCSLTPSGVLSGGVTVSAFSALHATFGFDNAVNNSLICE